MCLNRKTGERVLRLDDTFGDMEPTETTCYGGCEGAYRVSIQVVRLRED